MGSSSAAVPLAWFVLTLVGILVIRNSVSGGGTTRHGTQDIKVALNAIEVLRKNRGMGTPPEKFDGESIVSVAHDPRPSPEGSSVPPEPVQIDLSPAPTSEATQVVAAPNDQSAPTSLAKVPQTGTSEGQPLRFGGCTMPVFEAPSVPKKGVECEERSPPPDVTVLTSIFNADTFWQGKCSTIEFLVRYTFWSSVRRRYYLCEGKDKRDEAVENNSQWLVAWISNGVGNMVLPLLSFIILGALSGRMVTAPIIGEFAIAYEEFYHPLELKLENTPEVLQWGVDAEKTREGPKTGVRHMKKFEEEFPALVCGFDQVKEQYISTATVNWFAPHLMMNPTWRKSLVEAFPASTNFQGEMEVDMFEALFRFIFTPKSKLKGYIDRYVDTNFKGKTVVGVQLRMHNIYMKAGDDDLIEKIWDCAEHLGKQANGEVIYFLATDEPSAREKSIAREGDKLVHADAERKELPNLIEAYLDLYLLSKVDTLISTGWSSYGYVARGLHHGLDAAIGDWSCKSNGCRNEEWKTEQFPVKGCYRLPMRSPCAHHRWKPAAFSQCTDANTALQVLGKPTYDMFEGAAYC